MDEMYDNADETDRINLEDGSYVDFCKHFKYLGSYASYHLRDDYDIDKRLAAAYGSMGALTNYWNNPHVDLFYKYQIFMMIPLNLLLWGCESWALKEANLNKLDFFLHKSICRIMKIPMSQVREGKLKSEKA